MGVLEARKDAEKITYPVVGEKTKDADNVIDYDIREEQTKDISAEINANNQTTTGMATVIPGVNAPKLIESTSIISSPKLGYIYAAVQFRGEAAGVGTYEAMPVTIISDQIGEPQFTKTGPNNRFCRVPADGVYKLDIFLPPDGSQYYFSYEVYTSEAGLILSQNSQASGVTVTKTREMKKGEYVYAFVTIRGSSSWTGWVAPYIVIEFTRLG